MPVRVILIEPSHPGNIGAVARAMGNMGISDLAMVQPAEYRVDEARVRSANNEDILANAETYDTLEEAIADCSFVVGTSARIRTIGWPNKKPEEAMSQVAAVSEKGETVALVFGPERSGLSNRHIDLCDVLVRIPVNEKAPSINLAGAVLILLYELRKLLNSNGEADTKDSSVVLQKGEQMATHAQIHGFFEHLQDVMEEVEFIICSPREKLMRKIRRIFLRPGLTEDEVNILRGLLTAVTKKSRESRRSLE